MHVNKCHVNIPSVKTFFLLSYFIFNQNQQHKQQRKKNLHFVKKERERNNELDYKHGSRKYSTTIHGGECSSSIKGSNVITQKTPSVILSRSAHEDYEYYAI